MGARIIATLCVLAIGCNAPAERRCSAPQETAIPQPLNQPDDSAQFTGTLRGGVIAIGAETTGWILESDDGRRIDVEVSKVADAAAELEGKRVVVEGAITSANWVERGEQKLLMAERIMPAGNEK